MNSGCAHRQGVDGAAEAADARRAVDGAGADLRREDLRADPAPQGAGAFAPETPEAAWRLWHRLGASWCCVCRAWIGSAVLPAPSDPPGGSDLRGAVTDDERGVRRSEQHTGARVPRSDPGRHLESRRGVVARDEADCTCGRRVTATCSDHAARPIERGQTRLPVGERLAWVGCATRAVVGERASIAGRERLGLADPRPCRAVAKCGQERARRPRDRRVPSTRQRVQQHDRPSLDEGVVRCATVGARARGRRPPLRRGRAADAAGGLPSTAAARPACRTARRRRSLAAPCRGRAPRRAPPSAGPRGRRPPRARGRGAGGLRVVPMQERPRAAAGTASGSPPRAPAARGGSRGSDPRPGEGRGRARRRSREPAAGSPPRPRCRASSRTRSPSPGATPHGRPGRFRPRRRPPGPTGHRRAPSRMRRR